MEEKNKGANPPRRKRTAPLTEEERRRRARIIRKKRQVRRRKRRLLLGLCAATLILIIAAGFGISGAVKKHRKTVEGAKRIEQEAKKEEQKKASAIEAARLQAQQYNYDEAIAILQAHKTKKNSQEIEKAVGEYEEAKSELVEVDLNKVTHVFYHSLVVDPSKAFQGVQGAQFNMWMTTVSEFNKICKSMYDKGFVLIRLRDMVEQTTDSQGNVKFTPAKIMLPPDKKPFVMSLDDLSYYHSYDGYGIATKLVIDDSGKVTCEYKEDDGSVKLGSYDCVPLLDDFIEEHPDFSYKGAKGLIALTGYNGILGYRTDESYKERPDDLDTDKVEWLEAHPDFNLETERAQAKKVADAMKENGWEFGSHTWGHQYIAEVSLEKLKVDTQKWMDNVAPLVGGTDTIVFAHGQDLIQGREYTRDNEKYNYLKEQGFNFYCNVDGSQYWTQIKEDYVRQGRRNLDGYRMYHNPEMVSDLFDAAEVFDKARPTPVAQE